MPSSKFKFVSPGVFLNEIDNSQLTSISVPGRVGPVVIGTSQRGPSFLPTQVNSFSEFVEIFGNPVAGGGTLRNDQYRDGSYTLAPTYGVYAAQAYLRNNTPLTYVRLTADQHDNATTVGAAGWPQDNQLEGSPDPADNAGAVGMFLINSGTAAELKGAAGTAPTGTLGAIWYLKKGVSLRLRGIIPTSDNGTHSRLVVGTGSADYGAAVTGSGVFIENTHANRGFTAVLRSGSAESVITFDFDPESPRFIRKVFNTNPVLTNADIVDQGGVPKELKGYWLGESYEDFVERQITQNAANKVFGFVAPIGTGSAGGALHGADHRIAPKRGRSPWTFAQDLNAHFGGYDAINMPKLFRFHTLQAGEWEQNNLKISITNVKAPTNEFNEYGTFSVQVRSLSDSDKHRKVLEQYDNVNLNPQSENYIGRVIGDKNREWNYEERRYREYGKYDNRSKFIRVEVTGTIDEGMTDPRYLPFGFYGVPRFGGFKVSSIGMSSFTNADAGAGSGGGGSSGQFVVPPSGNMPHVPHYSQFTQNAGAPRNGVIVGRGDYSTALTMPSASFIFPETPLVVSASSAGASSQFDSCFGVDVYRNGSSVKYNKGFTDYLRMMPEGLSEESGKGYIEVPYYFSLDEVQQVFTDGATPAAGARESYSTTDAAYISGSRKSGNSITATGSFLPLKTSATASYKSILKAGYNQFTMPLFGGFEGTDITEQYAFRNSLLKNKTETTSYAYNSVRKAIDTVTDPEIVEANILAIPGLTETSLQDRLLSVAEDRSDALALIDLEGDFTPFYENKLTETKRTGSVSETVDKLRLRQINNSYGAAYYPYVQIQDTINNQLVNVPPSVVALGTLGSAETFGELWFAPAGFNRGGLSAGVAGVPVVNVKQKLSSEERDDLYDANINPIASFPTEGIVIFGQKTLQVTPSALDRINVRRLLIFIKKQISRIANNLLFEQNVSATWQRFLDQVNPLMTSIQARYGLTDFRVVLDETTTTPDLVDRNIMYAKIFLQPARSIEFIAVDFVITNTGAGFQD
tara:strand:- start:2454 stop:5543 length:3090 start_codon:yes stop_codon:yes gene_type:complete